MPERIDAHHHLWNYRPDQYEWIGANMSALARDFLPADLEIELRGAGVQGAVAVQARQTLEETAWLLSLASRHSFIRGVVGWAPLASPELPGILAGFAGNAKLKGLRHVIQDEADENFMRGADFNRGISSVGEHGLVYDILIHERQLPAAIEFVDAHPHQVFVLDHLAKPRIRARQFEPWRSLVAEIARRENVCCKLSGMVTEADWAQWRADDLRPYIDAALESFGADRLMAGSDWPVCLLASTYARWFETLREAIAPLSESERDMILGGTAAKVYGLNKKVNARRA